MCRYAASGSTVASRSIILCRSDSHSASPSCSSLEMRSGSLCRFTHSILSAAAFSLLAGSADGSVATVPHRITRSRKPMRSSSLLCIAGGVLAVDRLLPNPLLSSFSFPKLGAGMGAPRLMRKRKCSTARPIWLLRTRENGAYKRAFVVQAAH